MMMLFNDLRTQELQLVMLVGKVGRNLMNPLFEKKNTNGQYLHNAFCVEPQSNIWPIASIHSFIQYLLSFSSVPANILNAQAAEIRQKRFHLYRAYRLVYWGKLGIKILYD